MNILYNVYEVLIGTVLVLLIPLVILIIDECIELYREKKHTLSYNLLSPIQIVLYITIIIVTIIFIIMAINDCISNEYVKKACTLLLGPITTISSVYLSSSIKYYMNSILKAYSS